MKETLCFITGTIIGLLLYNWFLVAEVETKIEYITTTETKVDTVYITDTIKDIQVHQKIIRDTILVNYKPKIRAFKTTYNHIYGSVVFSGEVLGEVLKSNVTGSLSIPTITNTITKEKTVTKTVLSKGVYLGSGINSLMQYNIGASYVDNKYLFQYQYQPQINVHQIGIAKKLF